MPTDLPTADPPVRRRHRHHASRYKYLRKVQGYKYQLRLYVGGPMGNGVAIHLGLFDSEWLAGEAFKKVARLLRGPSDPLSVWQQVKPLMLAGVLPPTLLPMGVIRCDGKYFARRTTGSAPRTTVGVPSVASAGPFDTPEEAYHAWAESRRRPVG